MATPKGKGGNLETRRNPFTATGQKKGTLPELGDISGFGLALDKILRSGCAIIIGATRDNGSVVFTILDGDDRHRTYCSNPAELQDAIDAIDRLYGG